MNEAKLRIEDIQRPAQVDAAITKWWNSDDNRPMRSCSTVEAEARMKLASTVVDVILLAIAREPLVPSEEQAEEMYTRLHSRRTFGWKDIHDAIEEWQRRMFLRKSPKVLAEVAYELSKIDTLDIQNAAAKKAAKAVAMQTFELGKRLGSAKGGER